MQKLINILGSILMISSCSTLAVSCNNKIGDGIGSLSQTQKNMVNGAETMTKIILAGRHENLNYNVNELLSAYMTPVSSTSYLPTTYQVDGKEFNVATGLNNYKSLLSPTLSSFDQDNYAGYYASYLMGMYNNDFYNSFINSSSKPGSANWFKDTIDKNGVYGVNRNDKINALGYAAGFSKDISLSSTEDRARLAWGIQDNGPLTNYLLDNGYDGGFPGDTNGTGNPAGAAKSSNGGTNSSGYLYYNSIVARAAGKQNSEYGNDKNWSKNKKVFADSGLTLTENKKTTEKPTSVPFATVTDGEDNSTNFGEVGTTITNTAANLNIKGHVAQFAGYLNSITRSKSGTSILSLLLNSFFPILKAGGSVKSEQVIASGLGYCPLPSIWDKNTGKITNNAMNALKILDNNEEDWNIFSGVHHNISLDIGTILVFGAQTVDNVFKDDESTKKAVELLDLVIRKFEGANNETKEQFTKAVFLSNGNKEKGIFAKTLSKIMVIGDSGISEDEWNNVVLRDNGQCGVNLLKMAKRYYEAILKFSPKNTKDGSKSIISQIDDAFKGKEYNKLNDKEKDDYNKMLGLSGSGFKDGSILDHAYDTFQSPGSDEFKELLSAMSNSTSSSMKDPHENVFKYIFDDNYWKIKDVNVTSVSNYQKYGKMSFVLDYSGNGDSSSMADEQYKKVDLSSLKNFNPYQTILKNQEDKLTDAAKSKLDLNRTSGKVLGKDLVSDLKDYDGLGMLEDMKRVHHYYKVEWENISQYQDTPYWVITSIHCYNDKNKEFYNIY